MLAQREPPVGCLADGLSEPGRDSWPAARHPAGGGTLPNRLFFVLSVCPASAEILNVSGCLICLIGRPMDDPGWTENYSIRDVRYFRPFLISICPAFCSCFRFLTS